MTAHKKTTAQNKHMITWSPKDTSKVLAGFFGINGVLLLLAGIHAKKNTFDFLITENQTFNGILLYIASALTFLLPLYFFAVKGKKVRLSDFGIKPITLLQAIKTVLIGYGLLFLLTIIIAVITYYIGDIPGIGVQESILPVFGEGRIALITASIIAVAIAPAVEEIFFRGFLLGSLMSKFSFFTSSIITSTIFALAHFQFESILGIFILSLIINHLYKINGNSTSATIIFHMVNNTVAIVVLLRFGEQLTS